MVYYGTAQFKLYTCVLVHACGYTGAHMCFMRVKVYNVECIFFVARGFVVRTRVIQQSWRTRHAPQKQTYMSVCSVNCQPHMMHHMNKLITSASSTIKYTWYTRHATHK